MTKDLKYRSSSEQFQINRTELLNLLQKADDIVKQETELNHSTLKACWNDAVKEMHNEIIRQFEKYKSTCLKNIK